MNSGIITFALVIACLLVGYGIGSTSAPRDEISWQHGYNDGYRDGMNQAAASHSKSNQKGT